MQIKMKSERPLYIEGQVVTEFETNEQHARELETRGQAQRVGGTEAEQRAESEPARPPKDEPAEADPRKVDSEAKKARLAEQKSAR